MDRATAEDLVRQIEGDCDAYEAYVEPHAGSYHVVLFKLSLKFDPRCYDKDTYRTARKLGTGRDKYGHALGRVKYRNVTDPYSEHCHELPDGRTVRIIAIPYIIDSPGHWQFVRRINPCDEFSGNQQIVKNSFGGRPRHARK